jgi:two-component system, sensor histidine kinase PdtaS
MENTDAGAETSRSPRFTQRLTSRFAIVLALALLPLGIISLLQTRDLQAEVQGRAEAALLGATLRAAAGEIGEIRFAQGLVAALASDPDIVTNSADCAATMRRAAAQIPTATLVAFVPKSGLMTCSSNGRTYDFSESPLFEAVIGTQQPGFVVNRRGPVSGTSVLGVSHPVLGPFGDYLGIVSVSLPHDEIDKANAAPAPVTDDMPNPLLFWTFDRDGEVLTASSGLDRVGPQLPKTRRLVEFVGQPAQIVLDTSRAGLQRTYAVTPLVDGELYLMSSWDERRTSDLESIGLSRYMPPIIMWVVGMLVAGWTSERLVARHIRVLTRSFKRFAGGDRSLQRLDLSKAPTELREAGDAFVRMTDTIMMGEAHLEDTIHQKEVLLREVHHRVKNNLQLIASIMNIQMRKAIAPEAKVLLRGLQDRVMSLATIHRGLYQTSGLADVRADELFHDIVRQIVNMAGGADRKIDLVVEIDDLHLTPDQAVPLSLFLTEAVTNAMKYAGARPGSPVQIGVRLKREGGKAAVMEVTNSLAGQIADDADARKVELNSQSTGLGEQLLSAFSQQIGATLERHIDDHMFRLSVRFDVRHLTEAENRSKSL